MKIKNGCLSMENHDLDHIQGDIEDGCTPKEALINELELSGLNIKDVIDIQLNGNQLSQFKYVEIYSKIVADFWNNK